MPKYARIKIIITADSNKDLLEMFKTAYDALSEKEKQDAPTAVVKQQ